MKKSEQTLAGLIGILMLFCALPGEGQRQVDSSATGSAGIMEYFLQPGLHAPPDISAEENRRELAARGPAPRNLWRKIDGKVECIKGPGYDDYYNSWNAKTWAGNGSKPVFARGWHLFRGIVATTIPDGVLVNDDATAGSHTRLLLLINYPAGPADGDFVQGVAKDAGEYNYLTHTPESATLPRLDFGLIVDPPGPTPEQLKAAAQKKSDMAAKVLKANLEGAARGDSSDEYRLGQRCRDGDGVPKDLAQAREWFKKSAAQGEKDAARELNEMAP